MMAHVLTKARLGESHETHWWICELGSPLLEADRDPDFGRKAVRQAVERQSRREASDAFGNQLGDLGERMVHVKGSIRQLVEAARQPRDDALALEPGDRRCRDALRDQFAQPRHATDPEMSRGKVTLRGRGDGFH